MAKSTGYGRGYGASRGTFYRDVNRAITPQPGGIFMAQGRAFSTLRAARTAVARQARINQAENQQRGERFARADRRRAERNLAQWRLQIAAEEAATRRV